VAAPEQFDAREYLEGLVGQTIRTITGRPNTIVAVRGDDVLVRTERTTDPAGEPVPIEWVQQTAESLYADGEIGINTNEATHRSAFIGAVLSTLPGATGLRQPARVVLDRGAAGAPGRNPRWQQDELILALDVYFRSPRARQSKNDPAVAELSRMLRLLPLPIPRPDPGRFRNINSAFLKLQNFKAVDPDYPGEGMRAGATERERVLFERYTGARDELHAIASAIRAAAAGDRDIAPADSEADDEGVVEGRLLYRVHRARERRRGEEKKRQVLAATGRLACEVCDFDFLQAYGKRGHGFAECHHTRPLSDGERTTYLRDLAIVCSNCHRMLHRDRLIAVDELRAIVQTQRQRRLS
jgi:5-methylcytosine-specific restriction protein A